MKLARSADRPDLREIRYERLSGVTFPEYMHHNTPGNLYWGRLQARYPLIPIDTSMTWRRADGTHFDPWLRIHERVGGEILAAAPRSMVMEAPVAEWEEWTDMLFPADGEYVFPGAPAPLVVTAGVGRHVEPNVWVRHSAGNATSPSATTTSPSR